MRDKMTDIRPNYFNLQTLDVSDVSQEHDYLNSKIIEAEDFLSLGGVTKVDGLKVEDDSVVVESSPYPLVSHSPALAALSNYLDFPYDTSYTSVSRIYTVFQATASNLQRLDLRVQINAITSSSFVRISINNLSNPQQPNSALGDKILTTKIYTAAQLPKLEDPNPLTVDFSGDNDRQGLPVEAGLYYAITIDFTRLNTSQDVLRVFRSNQVETAAIDSSLYSWIYFGTRFQQGLLNAQAVLENFVIYHKVNSAAVKVSPGTAIINGMPVRIHETHRYLGLVERGPDHPKNYVVLQPAEVVAATDSAARTGNKSVSRIQDSYSLSMIGQSVYKDLVALGKPFMTLAIISDRNVLNFSTTQTFTLDPNSNLAYQDWLVPSNKQPSVAGLTVVEQRPKDLVFIVDNIPAVMPLTDYAGVPILDLEGQPQSDQVIQVYLDLYFNGGANHRPLLMSAVKETTSTPSYRTYAATLTDPNSTDLVSYSYPFDVKELGLDTYYNFRAITASGKEIYIQDFDKIVTKQNTSTDKYETIRDQQYVVVAERGDVTLVVK